MTLGSERATVFVVPGATDGIGTVPVATGPLSDATVHLRSYFARFVNAKRFFTESLPPSYAKETHW